MEKKENASLGTHYKLRCLSTGQSVKDDGMVLGAPQVSKSFLRAYYAKKQIDFTSSEEGIYRFQDWLPIRRKLPNSSAPVTFKSTKLAKKLNLENLYITLSGEFPEHGVSMPTGSFKECEAYSVCARLPENPPGRLVVASAGNTARAFAHVCGQNNIPLVVVIPEMSVEAMWLSETPYDCVKIVSVGEGADYFDAIHLAEQLSNVEGFYPEGGAKNVARRDGMGTTYLSAVETIGEIPDYYFQAVGSGTGSIAAWEANQRFIEDGRFSEKKTKLCLSQNSPFLVIHSAWQKKDKEHGEHKRAREEAAEIHASVLANRKPPYGLKGGLYDALSDTGGETYAISNQEAKEAAKSFEELEKIEPAPAASVAIASLFKAVQAGEVDKDGVIMLNITGGGMTALKQKESIRVKTPDFTIAKSNVTPDTIKEMIEKIS